MPTRTCLFGRIARQIKTGKSGEVTKGPSSFLLEVCYQKKDWSMDIILHSTYFSWFTLNIDYQTHTHTQTHSIIYSYNENIAFLLYFCKASFGNVLFYHPLRWRTFSPRNFRVQEQWAFIKFLFKNYFGSVKREGIFVFKGNYSSQNMEILYCIFFRILPSMFKISLKKSFVSWQNSPRQLWSIFSCSEEIRRIFGANGWFFFGKLMDGATFLGLGASTHRSIDSHGDCRHSTFHWTFLLMPKRKENRFIWSFGWIWIASSNKNHSSFRDRLRWHTDTTPKTNMEPTKLAVCKCFSFFKGPFLGSC